MNLFNCYLCTRGWIKHTKTLWALRANTNTVQFKLTSWRYTRSSILSTKWNLLIMGRIPVEGQYKRVELIEPIAPSDISVAEDYASNHIFVRVKIPLRTVTRVLDIRLPAISVYNPRR